jgi:CoA:oxalate CoA-transferase
MIEMNKRNALNELKVIELGQMVAGPYCGSLLAALGADVIKIEIPGKGDISRNSLPKKNDVSTYYIAYNSGKKGMTLNLKTEEGKEILKKLIAESDVLIENFRPGVMERLGFSYEKACEINPGIIYASISGFGQKGKYSKRACFDPIAQAMSGLMSVTGSRGGERVRCGASITDVLAGLTATVGILAALDHRRKTGKGQHIDVALVDVCISALASLNQIYLTTGKVPEPLGNSFEASAPGNCFPTADGAVVISAGMPAEWPKLAKVLGHEEWIDDPRFTTVEDRVRNRNVLDELISEETKKYSTDELLEKLIAVGLPSGPILSIDKVYNDPHFRDERKMFTTVKHPEIGDVTITSQGLKMSETNPCIKSCAPTLGQHNREILSSLGYSIDEIELLSERGVI